jgi:hypothetical protein
MKYRTLGRTGIKVSPPTGPQPDRHSQFSACLGLLIGNDKRVIAT